MGNFKLLDLTNCYNDKTKIEAIEKWIKETVEFQTPITLTDGANVDWDPTKNYNAQVTLAGNRTLRFPALPKGSYGTLKIIQDSVGSRTLTLPTQYTNKVANSGGGAISLTTTANHYDITSFYYDGDVLNWTLSNDFT